MGCSPRVPSRGGTDAASSRANGARAREICSKIAFPSACHSYRIGFEFYCSMYSVIS